MVGPLVPRAKHEIAFALTLSLLSLRKGSPRAERQTLCALLPPRRALSSSSRRLASPLATLGGNMLVGPAFLNADFSRFKNFPIHEAMKLRFRAEFFNAFNRPQWGTPDGTMTSFDPTQLPTIAIFLVSILSHSAGWRGMANPPSGHS